MSTLREQILSKYGVASTATSSSSVATAAKKNTSLREKILEPYLSAKPTTPSPQPAPLAPPTTTTPAAFYTPPPVSLPDALKPNRSTAIADSTLKTTGGPFVFKVDANSPAIQKVIQDEKNNPTPQPVSLKLPFLPISVTAAPAESPAAKFFQEAIKGTVEWPERTLNTIKQIATLGQSMTPTDEQLLREKGYIPPVVRTSIDDFKTNISTDPYFKTRPYQAFSLAFFTGVLDILPGAQAISSKLETSVARLPAASREVEMARIRMGFDPGETVTADALKQSYKRAAMVTHPDVGGVPGAFEKLNENYNTLRNALEKSPSGALKPMSAVDKSLRFVNQKMNGDIADLFSKNPVAANEPFIGVKGLIPEKSGGSNASPAAASSEAPLAASGSGDTTATTAAVSANKATAVATQATTPEVSLLAREPVSSQTLNAIQNLNPEQSAAFGRKIIDDLSNKLGINSKELEKLKLPEDTFIKQTPSVDGRPAQINSSGKIEIFLPNLVSDLKTLAEGKSILAHEGAGTTVYKMQPGESMSQLATRYVSDVLTHERAHLETMSAQDNATRGQLQQKVYEAVASKQPKAVTAAKTELENFMRGLETKAVAHEKANKLELQKKVFAGRTVNTSDLIKRAQKVSVKSTINKTTGVSKVNPPELRKKFVEQSKGARAGFKSGREIAVAQGKNFTQNLTERAKEFIRTKLLKQRITDRVAQEQKDFHTTVENIVKDVTEKRNKISVKQRQASLISHVDLLPQSSRGKFIRDINNTKTDAQFLRVIERIKKEANSVERAGLMRDIVSELKGTVIKKSGRFPNAKFAYDAQKTLNKIRSLQSTFKNNAAKFNAENPEATVTPYGLAQSKIAELISDFQTKNPDAAIPTELLHEIQLLKMVGIKDMNATELRSVLQDIKDIKETGRTQKELERANREAEIDRTKEAVKNVITGSKPLPSDQVSPINRGDIKKQNQLLQRTKEFLTTGQYGLEEVLDSLSQFDKSSKPYQSFLSKEIGGKVNKAFNLQNQGEIIQISKVNELVKEIYGLKKNKEILQLFEDLTKRVTLGKFRHSNGEALPLALSRDQAIKRYMELQDPTLDETFAESLGWTPEIIEKVKEMLTPADIRFADAQLEFYREYYKGVNAVFSEEFGVDLPFNEQYSPIARNVDVAVPESVILAQDASRYASTKNHSLDARVNSKIELSNTGAIETLVRHITKMEHYKAWSEPMSVIRKVFADKLVRQSIVDFHGRNYLDVMDNFLNDFARDGVTREKIVPIVDAIRANVTKAILGLNPSVAYKQLTGVLNYAIELPLDDFFKGIVSFWQSPLEKSRFLFENSPALQERFGEGFERDVKFAIKRNVGREISKTRNFSELMFYLIREADKFTVYHGSWTSFSSKYEEITGTSFDLKNYDPNAIREAIDYAEQITNRVQETSRLDTLSPIQRGGSLAKLFSMFQSQPSKYYRIMINAARNYRAGRGSKLENVKRLLMAWFIVPMVYQWAADKFDFNVKHQAQVMLLGPMSYPLITGQIFQSAFGWATGEPFRYEASPVFSMLDDIQNSISGLTKQDAVDGVKFTTYAADAAGKLTGVPTGIVTKRVRAVQKSMKQNRGGSSSDVTF